MSPDELTPSWFAETFGAPVSSIDHRPIGDGLVGMNLRVSVESPDPEVPTSVVVKLPSADPKSRATGVSLRNYEREVKFYAELASTVDVTVPRCWHASWDEASGDFVLVLQDMAPADQGDQLTGCSPAVARDVVAELARLHGPRWGDPSLDEIEWLSRRSESDATNLGALWEMFRPGFDETYQQYLTPDQSALLDAFGGRLSAWLAARRGPLTVTHGDFRLDNLLLGDGTAAPKVTAVDWQTPGHSTGSADLSYFIGAGLLDDDRRANERSLVGVYADGIEAYGIDIDRAQLWEDYRRESFGGVIMAVVASQVVGGSDRSVAMFTAMATRHLQQALDHDALALIP